MIYIHSKTSPIFLAIMTIIMFGGKRGMLASRRTPSQPWSTGVAASCCGGALLQEGLVHFTKYMASWGRKTMWIYWSWHQMNRWTWYLQAFGNCSQGWTRLVEDYNYFSDVLADIFLFSHDVIQWTHLNNCWKNYLCHAQSRCPNRLAKTIVC